MVEKKKLDQAAVNEAMGILLDPPGSDTARAKKTLKNATEEQKEKAREDLKDYDPSEKMAKGGKIGRATKRGTGKAMGGAYINYGKPVVYDKSFTSAKPLKSGGKVGMRGVGKAMRGYGKAMKRGK
jgi:hypothetical protein